MPYYRTEGIILKIQDFGEADKLVTFLSPELGKLTGIAKSAKKMNSSFSGKIEILNRIFFFLAQGKNLDIISQIKVLEHNQSLKQDLEKLAFASFILELFENFTIAQEKSTSLYKLLQKILELLAGPLSPRLVCAWGEILLLKLAGFAPLMNCCSNCKREQSINYFNLRLSGLLCRDCFYQFPASLALQPGTVKLYQFLRESSPEVLSRLSPSQSVIEELFDFLHTYVAGILNKNLKSAAFIRELAVSSKQLAALI